MGDDLFKTIVVVLLMLFSLGGVLMCSFESRRECESRSCPEGMTPRVVQYQGCLCLTEPK